jgi:hypothetical protein
MSSVGQSLDYSVSKPSLINQIPLGNKKDLEDDTLGGLARARLSPQFSLERVSSPKVPASKSFKVLRCECRPLFNSLSVPKRISTLIIIIAKF